VAYSVVLTCDFGSHQPNTADVRASVDGQTISSGISAIASTNGSGFEVSASLSDGYRGPFVFYDNADSTKYCVGSVGPEHEQLDANISSRSDLTASDIDTSIANYDAPTKAELDAAVAPLSTFDHTANNVITDAASRIASQADVSALATGANLSTAQGSLDDILADTNELQSDDIPAQIAALNNLSSTQVANEVSALATQASVDALPDAAAINAELDTALADYDGPTAAELAATQTAIGTALTTNQTALIAEHDATQAAIGGLSIPTVGEIATAVWAAATRTLTSAALSASDIWSFATRTITSGGITIADVEAAIQNQEPIDANVTQVSGSNVSGVSDFHATIDSGLVASSVASALAASAVDLTVISPLLATGDLLIVTHTTLKFSVSGDIPANWSKIIFTVKSLHCEEDADALIQAAIVESIGGSDHLITLNGSPAQSAAWGTLTVDQVAGTVEVKITDDATALLPSSSNLIYDIKWIDSNSDSGIMASGNVILAQPVTREI